MYGMGVQLAASLQLQNVAFETDCLSLIQKLNSNSSDLTALGLLIHSLCSSFCSFSFSYKPRTANGVVHILA